MLPCTLLSTIVVCGIASQSSIRNGADVGKEGVVGTTLLLSLGPRYQVWSTRERHLSVSHRFAAGKARVLSQKDARQSQRSKGQGIKMTYQIALNTLVRTKRLPDTFHRLNHALILRLAARGATRRCTASERDAFTSIHSHVPPLTT
jgi:hypothetical protein